MAAETAAIHVMVAGVAAVVAAVAAAVAEANHASLLAVMTRVVPRAKIIANPPVDVTLVAAGDAAEEAVHVVAAVGVTPEEAEAEVAVAVGAAMTGAIVSIGECRE